MGFVVEAWFYNSAPEIILELLCSALTLAGFTGASTLTPQTISWNCVTLEQRKVFVALSSRTENHIVVTVKAETSWNEGYFAFEQAFIYLLSHRQNIQLAELFLSTRNPEPYPFLTHSFHRGSFPPTIVNLDENRITQRGESDYWVKWGSELHFIADEVFERTVVNVDTLAHSLDAAIISLEGGILLDCGWTKEFALPKKVSFI